MAAAPSGATWWGRGWTLGVLSAVEPRGWPSGPCLGGERHSVKGVHLWRRPQGPAEHPLVDAGGLSSEFQPLLLPLPARTRVGIKTCKATGIEDAKQTPRASLVMELSNLEVRAGLGPAIHSPLGWAEGMGAGGG